MKTTTDKGLWVAQIPGLCGYGVMIVDTSKDKAFKKLRGEYFKFKKTWSLHWSFNEAYEYFGGITKKIEIGKPYYDNFDE